MQRHHVSMGTMLLAGLVMLAVGAPAKADNLQRALDHLMNAERLLEEAKGNKGGHKKKALEQIYKAEDEIHQAQQKARDEGKHHGHDHGGSGGGLQSLVGEPARSLDSEMGNRGYRNTGGYKDGGASFTTWYKRDKHKCVEVKTKDGDVESIKNIDEGNCQ